MDSIAPEHPSYITRTEGEQVEYTPSFDLETRFDIRWKDGCTYQIFNKKVVRGIPARAPEPNDTITVTILSLDEDGFDYIAASNYAVWRIPGRQSFRK